MRITIIMSLIALLVVGIFLGILWVLIRWLLYKGAEKYRGGKQEKEAASTRQSLGDALKQQRLRCGMPQEFVAQSLGVSRQAVSKWENGTSDPSTANLLALAKLYGVSAGELLEQVEH